MPTLRTLMLITALTTGSVALADTPPRPPADKPADKPAAAPDGTAKKEMISDADAQRFYTFFEQVVATVVANQDDCAKMATGIRAHVEANKALIKEMSDLKQQHKELPPAIKEKLTRMFADELQPAMTKKCSKDGAVIDAFQRIRAR